MTCYCFRRGAQLQTRPPTRARRARCRQPFGGCPTANDATHVRFDSGPSQTERLFVDGTREIRFPDGTLKRVDAAGVATSEFANGRVMIEYPNGIKARARLCAAGPAYCCSRLLSLRTLGR